MNAKISVFVTCDEVIIYLLKYKLHDCTFKENMVLFKVLSVFHNFEFIFKANLFFLDNTLNPDQVLH